MLFKFLTQDNELLHSDYFSYLRFDEHSFRFLHQQLACNKDCLHTYLLELEHANSHSTENMKSGIIALIVCAV